MARDRDLRFDTAVAALILKTGDYRLHHGGLGAIRSLGRAGVPVFGVHEDRFTPAARSAYLRGGFVWRTGDQLDYQRQLMDGVSRIAERIAAPCVVVPTDDHAAVFLDERADQLPEKLLVPALRPGLARDLVNKRRCAELAAQAGFATPRTHVLRCPAPESGLADVELPVVVKRAERALLPDGSRTYSTLIVRTRAELRAATTEPGGEYEVLLQEVVPGDNWLFHAYCDADSTSLVSFTGRKLRSYPAHAGETACARSEDNPELREQAEHFLRTVGFSGVVSMDVRHDGRDGTYRVLDVNPRAGAGFRMFQNVHGIDVVRALHLDLTGRPVPKGPQVDGRTYVVENYDLRAWRTYARDQGLTPLGLLRGMRAADERAWLSADDLVPVAVRALRGVVPDRWLGRGPTNPHYFAGRASGPSRHRVHGGSMEISPLVDFLAPFLAPLLEGAGRATAAVAGEAWDHAVRLWGRLSDGIRSRPAALEAAQDVAESPDSTGARDALAWQLEKLFNADTALREEVSALWSQATAAGVTVTNVTASGTRSIAIGRDVSGGSVSTGDAGSARPDADE